MKIGEYNYIRQLRRQDEKALMYVIETYGGLIKSVIRRHLFSLPHKQEECFDDVLLKIWGHISEFDESRNSFSNWAAAIARYRAIDYLRQFQKELDVVNIEDAVIAREDRMLSRMMEKEISEEMEKMLKCLKPCDRELFLKLYVEEKTMEEVSLETGMEKDVIYNRLSRGKKKIRKQFSIQRSI